MIKDIDNLGETFSNKLLYWSNYHLSAMLMNLNKLVIK